MKNRAATSHWPIAMGVLCLHFAAIALLITRGFDFGRYRPIEEKSEAIATAFIINDRATQDRLPMPEVVLDAPKVPLNSIRSIQFESAEWGDISGIVAPASAPQLARLQPVDAGSFARHAGLAPGRAASVILIVEVLPDGRAGSVELSRGSGDALVDAAAIAYARLLRWVPGTRAHQPEAMRVNLPVTLVWNA